MNFRYIQRRLRANVCTNVSSGRRPSGAAYVSSTETARSVPVIIALIAITPSSRPKREPGRTVWSSPCGHAAMDGMIQGKKFESTPTTIHCATVMRTVHGDEKIIMAVSKKDVITLESRAVNDEVDTYRVELNFPNVPSTAEIQSVHCINKSEEFDDFAVGIAYAWTTVVDEVSSEMYGFNVYSGFPGSSLEAIMENCETLKLDFVPFLLEHAIYLCETHTKGMWLLSGNDQKIHAYKSDEQQICEQKIEDYFIEFQDINKCVPMNFGTKSFSDYKKRISFYGNNMGILMFIIVDSEKNQILHSFTKHFESPISVLQLFNIYNRTVENINNFSAVDDVFVPNVHIINEKEPICFLVGSVIDGAIVYMNVLENYLKNGIILKDSKRYGGIMSSLITDINFDCKNEILIGTEGNYILSYAYKNNRWVKQQPYDMKDHVYTINYLDINGEGVNDIVVMSETGVHIIKHEPKDIVKILKSRLQL